MKETEPGLLGFDRLSFWCSNRRGHVSGGSFKPSQVVHEGLFASFVLSNGTSPLQRSSDTSGGPLAAFNALENPVDPPARVLRVLRQGQVPSLRNTKWGEGWRNTQATKVTRLWMRHPVLFSDSKVHFDDTKGRQALSAGLETIFSCSHALSSGDL